MKSFLYRTPSVLLCVLAGLLLFIAWPPTGLFFLGFFPFALLLIVEDKIPAKKGHYFWHLYLALLIWNVATTYWVFFATPIGSLAWILNALLMTLPWLLYRWVKTMYGLRIGLFALIGGWLAFEWLHFNWELAWPWLALGNVFAKTPSIVQWYEWTGTGGGSLWVLLINILLFLMVRNQQKLRTKSIALLAILVIPLICSLLIGNSYTEKGDESNFLVIQPNFDPYERTFDEQEEESHEEVLYRLAAENVEKETDFIIFSESSLPGNPWKTELNTLPEINRLKGVLEETTNGSIIIGADVLKKFQRNEEISATARYVPQGNFHYDLYNAVLFLPKDSANAFYAKSKLVPGVERMPYPKYLPLLQKFAIDLGGIGGSRATQRERTVFQKGTTRIGAGICYESVFGDYMNDFVKNGAEVLVIITNDGWWRNTSGYKQHLHYARLRAIETRRSIARSANTGISALINQKGELLAETNWWEQSTLRGTLKANQEQTFYTKYGDYIYRVGLLFTCIIVLITFVKSKTDHFKFR